MLRKFMQRVKAYRRRRFRSKANDLWQLLKEIREEIGQLRTESELRFVDMLTLMKKRGLFDELESVILETQHPVAIHSPDHLHPHGTRRDNTRHLRFRHACEQYFKKRIRFLDLGCSGGGLVLDFILGGHLGVGLEGSDYSLIRQRAQWPVIEDYLFTCDITYPFAIKNKHNREPLTFDLVSCWEVLEHLSKPQLVEFFKNVHQHLADDGLFCASVTTRDDIDKVSGVNWHATVEPKIWWEKLFRDNGFTLEPNIFSCADFPRGNGLHDPSYAERPQDGFHVVLRKA